MWNIIKSFNPVWHIDATGCLIKPVPLQKAPFYYAIVCHDNINNKINSVAEFVTTQHDSTNISKYLISIKKYFEIAPFIVVDESYAIINAVMESFNGVTILNYINWTFNVLNLPETNIMSNNLYHFMKTKVLLFANKRNFETPRFDDRGRTL